MSAIDPVLVFLFLFCMHWYRVLYHFFFYFFFRDFICIDRTVRESYTMGTIADRLRVS